MMFDLLLASAIVAICSLCVWASARIDQQNNDLDADTYARMKALAARKDDSR